MIFIPPVDGDCMCGQVRIRVRANPLITMACHCRGCQRLSASAFSLSALLPADAVDVAGETAIGALHGASRYEYCPHCLNWLLTRPAGAPLVNVRPSMFDMPAWSAPFIETFTREKLSWATTPAKHSFPGYPPDERYGALMAEFAAQLA